MNSNRRSDVRIIVSEEIADAVRGRLAGEPVELLVAAPDGSSEADLSRAEGLLRSGFEGEGFDRVFEAATGLRWLHMQSAGVDGVDFEPLRERSIVLTNSAGVHGVPIAEWVLYAMLSIVKRGPQMLQAQHEHRWETSAQSDELTGKTLTILGAGGIGAEIARRAAAFDMRIWGVNRSGREQDNFDRIESDAWRDLLPDTDFLVVATPLTNATRGMIGAAELDMLSERAWLINIARGAIVDEQALIERLRDKRIGGAALDTFEQEPLPADSPLWELPDVIISPHHSGSSPHTMDRVVSFFADNVKRFAAGEELLNIVDYTNEY